MILICILTLLALTAVAIVRLRGLFPLAMMTGIYSFLGASWMLLADAPDVAFTEAAVGAGISTVLMLGALSLAGRSEKPIERTPWGALILVTLTGAVLIYGTLDLPHYGAPDAPAHQHVAPEYIADHVESTRFGTLPVHIDNIVTTVLASYRGYDTLGETAVIFTAAIAVLILLREFRARRREDELS